MRGGNGERQSGRTGFRPDGSLDDTEKRALLRFAVSEFDLGQPVVLTSVPSVAAQFNLQELINRNSKIDLIYWERSDSLSHDSHYAANYLSLLSRKGIVCVDGPGIAIFEAFARMSLQPILETSDFSVFARNAGERSIASMRYELDLFRRRHYVESMRHLRRLRTAQPPLVAVIVLTYQHEQYILECLNSVLRQRGRFNVRIIVIDDASTDRTAHIAAAILEGRSNREIEVDLRVNKENVGVVENLAAAVRLAEFSDYVTFCEGDDFWSSDSRIQEHIDFLGIHPECVMSFNTIELCSADGSSRCVFADQAVNPHDVVDGPILASNNLIGNFTACFYEGCLVNVIPAEMFGLYAVDWLFNLYCAQFGGLGHLRKPLSVYRQHSGGEWSGRSAADKLAKLWKHIGQYNRFLDYQFDYGFQEYKRMLLVQAFGYDHDGPLKFELLVFDDAFPSPRSGFRLAEFTGYLREFPTAMVLTSGLALPVLGNAPLDSVLRQFQRQQPELGNQILISRGRFPVQLGKLLYVNFLNNAYDLLPVAEAARVPFAFTLYPGGGFTINTEECDRKLKRIFDSPCFGKVVVTQQITYDYIVKRDLCPADKVELIFGVVTPTEALDSSVATNKSRWGFDKDRLDICFMAHRYTRHGEDKGYDVFVNMAGELRKRYDDIYFHVVGPYDKHIMDVSSIRDRLEFYGTIDPAQFDSFFGNMDIIVSPNVSGMIFPGSFDGFPTASCIEAGLRGTAIFATDEFGACAGRFLDGQDLVLINYDLNHIVEKVQRYYADPAALKAIGDRGGHRIRQLYSYECQMLPRLRMLRELIETPFVFHAEKLRRLSPIFVEEQSTILNLAVVQGRSRFGILLRKYSPEPVKHFYRTFVKRCVEFMRIR
jgi:glycosyltransferase involved in cell wall biosynthesis